MKKLLLLLFLASLQIAGAYTPPLNPQPVSTVSSGASVTPTITASAYTAGYEVGALMSFTSAARNSTGVLQSIVINCKTVQTTAFKLYLFNANPSNSTWTDKAAPSINSADVAKLIGVYTLVVADSGLGTVTLYNIDGIGKNFTLASSGTTLYGVLVCTATPTFGSTSDLTVYLGINED